MMQACVPRLFASKTTNIQQRRSIQVTIVGASSKLGSKLALKMKQNPKITKLKLYDVDGKVKNIAKDLEQLPVGPPVISFFGDQLRSAVTMSELILMVHNTNNYDMQKNEAVFSSAPAVQKVCEAMADRCPDSLLGISTAPINSMVPFACALLYKYNCFNPFKIFGITNIDVLRTQSLASYELKVNPRHLTIPVIGGRSDETVIPLFSNLKPAFYQLDDNQTEALSRMVKSADISYIKRSMEHPTAALAWSINDTIEKVVDALRGEERSFNCYSANPNFGTRFFAGPVSMGPTGITRTCNNFSMNSLECELLCNSTQLLNEDVSLGEEAATQFD